VLLGLRPAQTGNKPTCSFRKNSIARREMRRHSPHAARVEGRRTLELVLKAVAQQPAKSREAVSEVQARTRMHD
jgi:hypothetical protein